jgi:hypothetical protein
MSGGWKGSDRRERLPANWAELVKTVKIRSGGRCEFRLRSGARCPRPGDGGVDHVQRGDDHRLENLRDSCQDHHGKKSSAEGNEAKKTRKVIKRPETHPRGSSFGS